MPGGRKYIKGDYVRGFINAKNKIGPRGLGKVLGRNFPQGAKNGLMGQMVFSPACPSKGGFFLFFLGGVIVQPKVHLRAGIKKDFSKNKSAREQ